MRSSTIRRPVSGALIMYGADDIPAVSLRYTAGSIPPRLRRLVVSRAIVVQRRRCAGLKPGVKRSETPGMRLANIFNPWQGVAENGALKITFIKRQTMRP